MKRLALTACAALSLTFTATADASPTSVFKAKMGKHCGDGARWYCHMDMRAYCPKDRHGTAWCEGTYTEGDVLAGSRMCFASGRVFAGMDLVAYYVDSCHRKGR